MNHAKSILLKLPLLIVAALTVGPTAAPEIARAEDLTLHKAIQEALRDSLSIQKSESQLHENEYKKIAAVSSFLPSLTGSVSYLPEKKYMLVDMNLGSGTTTIQQVVPTTIYSLKAQWPIFEGGAGLSLYQSASAAEDSARLEHDWQKFLVSRQAIQSFYSLLAQKALLEVSFQNKKALEDHLKDIKAYQSVGASTHYDVLRVETQLSLAESELLSTEDNIEVAKSRLGEVLGKEKEIRELSGQFPPVNAALIEGVKIGETSQRGDLQALGKKVEAGQLLANSASKFWIPRLSLVGEFNRYNNVNDRFNDNNAFRESYFAGLNLSWNIFDGFSSYGRSGQQLEQSRQLEKTFQQTALKAKQDFEFWRRKFLYFCTVTTARQNDVRRTEEAVRLAKAGQKAGVRTSTDLLDAEVDLFRAKASLVNAQLGSIEAITQIEIATGKQLLKIE